jgi:hypothetical protein
MREARSRQIAGYAILASSLLLLGCGGRGDVNGKVTYQDKAVVFGSVMIVGSDKKLYYGQINEDGSYKVTGVPTGEAKVAVSSPDPNQVAAKGGAPKIEAKKWFAIPPKYGDPEKSGLKLSVNGGSNPFDIPLK